MKRQVFARLGWQLLAVAVAFVLWLIFTGTPEVVTYFLMAASFACTASSLSFMRLMRPKTSDRSSVSIEIPEVSKMRSE